MNRRRVMLATAVVLAAIATGITGLAIAQSPGGDGNPSRVSELLAESAARLQDPTKYTTSEGAIAFPPGVSYPEAVLAFHVAQTTGQGLAGLEAVPALPEGKVALLPTGAGGRVIIDLAAPYGYDRELGAALSATYTAKSVPAEGAPRSAVGPWYAGWSLVVPGLPACMVATSPNDATGGCGPEAKVSAGSSVPLP